MEQQQAVLSTLRVGAVQAGLVLVIPAAAVVQRHGLEMVVMPATDTAAVLAAIMLQVARLVQRQPQEIVILTLFLAVHLKLI